MLTMKGVWKSYGSTPVLRDVDLRITPGEFVCVTGPSGAGKSTLLHLLIGAEAPTKGAISVDGADLRTVPPAAMQLFRRHIGVVFQDYKLLWEMTVAENVAFPLEVCGMADAAIASRVTAVLREMGLLKKAHTPASALSGGEKARTAIARAIVHKPMILLADEPTGNLDPEQSEEVIELFRSVHKGGTTVVLATHHADLVDRLKTRVVRLEEGAVVRDSVGSYARGKSPAPPRSAGSHHIFTEESPAAPPSPPDAPARRKVKVTAIQQE